MARDYIHWVPGERLMKRIGRWHTRLYRLTRGRLGGRMEGLDILLLTTTGRRSGEPRTSPLPYFRYGDRLVLIASFGGADRHPLWYRNLEAQPQARVQIGGRVQDVLAETARGDERETIWKQVCLDQPRYEEYQRKTTREIPVVLLRSKGESPA